MFLKLARWSVLWPWAQICSAETPACVPLNSCMYTTFTNPCIFQAKVCVWLCAFPHLRKENVRHSTGEHSHYRRRSWSLEATALQVVWTDRVSFSPRRAVEHTLCHYQCPAVQTSLLPYFSFFFFLKKKKKQRLTKTNKHVRAANMSRVKIKAQISLECGVNICEATCRQRGLLSVVGSLGVSLFSPLTGRGSSEGTEALCCPLLVRAPLPSRQRGAGRDIWQLSITTLTGVWVIPPSPALLRCLCHFFPSEH